MTTEDDMHAERVARQDRRAFAAARGKQAQGKGYKPDPTGRYDFVDNRPRAIVNGALSALFGKKK